MKRKLESLDKFSGNAGEKSTAELTVYDAPPAVLEARHRVKELLKLDDVSAMKALAGEVLLYLNTAVRAMAKDDLALIMPEQENTSEAA